MKDSTSLSVVQPVEFKKGYNLYENQFIAKKSKLFKSIWFPIDANNWKHVGILQGNIL